MDTIRVIAVQFSKLFGKNFNWKILKLKW